MQAHPELQQIHWALIDLISTVKTLQSFECITDLHLYVNVKHYSFKADKQWLIYSLYNEILKSNT